MEGNLLGSPQGGPDAMRAEGENRWLGNGQHDQGAGGNTMTHHRHPTTAILLGTFH
jgi:hypothetical protein